MTQEPTYIVSNFHRDLMRWLERRGVTLMEEVPFPPYTVDIYLSSWHVVIEADGPHHTEVRDRERDWVLTDRYHLKILHVNYELFGDSAALIKAVAKLLTDSMEDRDQRWEKCRMKTPWL